MSDFGDWPPELLVRVIKAMAPGKVCMTCGEPQRRISEAASSDLLGSVIRKAREALGMSQKDVAAWFPSATGGITGCVWNWENGANVPMADQWERLKEGLGIGDEYDYLLPDREAVSYTPQSGPGRGTTHLPPKVNPAGRGFEWHEATRTGAIGFSDCGHDNYRPGVVLDPFGTGVTAEVASAVGRDGIEISE